MLAQNIVSGVRGPLLRLRDPSVALSIFSHPTVGQVSEASGVGEHKVRDVLKSLVGAGLVERCGTRGFEPSPRLFLFLDEARLLGFSSSEMRVILALIGSGRRTKDLVRELGVSRQRIHSAASGLVHRGHLERQWSLDDSREFYYILSDSGVGVAKDMLRLYLSSKLVSHSLPRLESPLDWNNVLGSGQDGLVQRSRGLLRRVSRDKSVSCSPLALQNFCWYPSKMVFDHACRRLPFVRQVDGVSRSSDAWSSAEELGLDLVCVGADALVDCPEDFFLLDVLSFEGYKPSVFRSGDGDIAFRDGALTEERMVRAYASGEGREPVCVSGAKEYYKGIRDGDFGAFALGEPFKSILDAFSPSDGVAFDDFSVCLMLSGDAALRAGPELRVLRSELRRSLGVLGDAHTCSLETSRYLSGVGESEFLSGFCGLFGFNAF